MYNKCDSLNSWHEITLSVKINRLTKFFTFDRKCYFPTAMPKVNGKDLFLSFKLCFCDLRNEPYKFIDFPELYYIYIMKLILFSFIQ